MGYRETFANIHLDAIKWNINYIEKKSNKKVFAVVKANAYGHGIIEVSKYLENNGIDYLCVSSLDEAVLLRKNHIKSPILILGYVNPLYIAENLHYDFTYSVISLDWLLKFLNENLQLTKIKLHLKLDTGMNRLGIKGFNEFDEVIKISKLYNIKYEGVFSHYHSSEDKSRFYSKQQFDLFYNMIVKSSIDFKWIHIANTDASFSEDEKFSNAVRCGISLYGYSTHDFNLKRALDLYSVIAQIKKVRINEIVGYSASHMVSNESNIAIVPIGYGDGFNRHLQGATLYVGSHPVKIIGRVSMDQINIEYPDNYDGKIVEIIGNNQDAKYYAQYLNTIPYEILTSLSTRITRNYYEHGNLLFTKDYQ